MGTCFQGVEGAVDPIPFLSARVTQITGSATRSLWESESTDQRIMLTLSQHDFVTIWENKRSR